jgi:hypothetical protein
LAIGLVSKPPRSLGAARLRRRGQVAEHGSRACESEELVSAALISVLKLSRCAAGVW